MAPDVGSSYGPKKSRAADPLADLASTDAPSMAPSRAVGASIVTLRAPVTIMSSEFSSIFTRSEKDVIIIDTSTVAPSSVAQPTIVVPAL